MKGNDVFPEEKKTSLTYLSQHCGCSNTVCFFSQILQEKTPYFLFPLEIRCFNALVITKTSLFLSFSLSCFFGFFL